jgi:hypothetical protein
LTPGRDRIHARKFYSEEGLADFAAHSFLLSVSSKFGVEFAQVLSGRAFHGILGVAFKVIEHAEERREAGRVVGGEARGEVVWRWFQNTMTGRRTACAQW